MIQLQPLSQTDPRWKDDLLGFDAAATIEHYGCLLTCLAMAANALGSNETPGSLNQKMKAINGFIGDMVKIGAISSVLPGIKLGSVVQCVNQPAPLAQINAQLAAGVPAIVEVDYSPDPGIQNHWILIYGQQGDDYLVHDPHPYPVETGEVTMSERYGFAGSPQQVIQSIVFLSGHAQPLAAQNQAQAGMDTTPAASTQAGSALPAAAASTPSTGAATGQPGRPKPVPQPIRTSGDIVYAAVDELALRMDPFVGDDNLISRLPLNTRLVALEAKNQQQAKIGQVNQWLKVQETGQGYEGYVAAWYVSVAQAPPEAAPTETVPQTLSAIGPGQIVVYATAPLLAFRSQPVVQDATLIRWVTPNTQFLVLEPAEQASAKIGVDNTWLHVKDVSGQQGYVAGAYVALASPGVTAGVRPKGSLPAQPSGSNGRIIVRPTVDGLALRSQPAIAPANMIKREPLAADLALLEPPDQARPKIGVVNQWLKVRDIQGSEGYVAAWYVA